MVLVVCGLGGVGLGVVLDGFPGHFRLLWVWYNMRLLGFATCGLLRIFEGLAVLVIYGLDSVLGGFPGCFRFLWGWYNISLRVDCVCGLLRVFDYGFDLSLCLGFDMLFDGG